MTSAWNRKVTFAEIGRGPVRLLLEPDAEARAALAKELELESLPSFSAKVEVKPWLDGVEMTGRLSARVGQICGVSLEPFEQDIATDITLRFLPGGSPNAGEEVAGGELTLDPDAPDPPEVLDTEEIDVTAYVVELLALEIDPFPRKPGAVFDYAPPEPEPSPFDVLKRLKDQER